MNPTELIQPLYEGTIEERGRALVAVAAPDILWQESEGYIYGGLYRGLQEVYQEVFVRQATEWDDFHNHAEQFIAEGNSVVALGFYEGTHKQTQKTFRARFAHHWKLDEGKVVKFVQYIDSHPVWLATTSE